MVSMTNIVIMVACVIVCIAALAVPYVIINRRSSKLEAGFSGAVGYGLLGYVWQYVIYMYFGLLLGKVFMESYKGSKAAEIVLSLLLTVLSTLCTVVSLYWGIYLTNQKQVSLYRSAAVGIGFSLGKMGIDLIYPYLQSVYFSFQINNGTFQAREDIRTSILESTTGSLIAGAYKCILMSVIIFAMTLIMGKFYVGKERGKTWISALCIYEVIMLVNVALKYIFQGGFEISFMIVFTLIAAAGGLVLWNWFKTNEVEVNPLAVLRGLRK